MPAVPFSTDAERLTAILLSHLPANAQTEGHLRQALTDTLAHPGRLARAQLVLAAAQAHGLPAAAGEKLACAVEYYHVASLLLDDLPCMDDATTRRGQLCVHRVHGEATAILAALALINRAYALIGFALAYYPALARLRVQALLDATLGVAGLVGGQARDLRFAESAQTPREIQIVALQKTGALFLLAVLLPALLADPSPAEYRRLRALCHYWDLAYQAIDDLRDELATSVDTGKTTRRDRVLARPNLVLALGVPAVRRQVRRLAQLAENALGQLGERWSYLAAFHREFFMPGAVAVTQAA